MYKIFNDSKYLDREKFGLSLPDDWLNIIQDYPHMFSIIKDALMDRVYPILSHKVDGECKLENSKLNNLALPWNEKYWNVFITSVSSTLDIWGRLIGPEFSVSYTIL